MGGHPFGKRGNSDGKRAAGGSDRHPGGGGRRLHGAALQGAGRLLRWRRLPAPAEKAGPCDRQHCKNRVEEAVGDISGAAARVNLKKGLVTVFYAREIDDQTIREKIEKAGYTLTGPL